MRPYNGIVNIGSRVKHWVQILPQLCKLYDMGSITSLLVSPLESRANNNTSSKRSEN